MKRINFCPLKPIHFEQLLKWLTTPHVRSWWPESEALTFDWIQNKYSDYTQGFKIEKGVRKKIEAFIFKIDDIPIGYIQLYNVHDFRRSSVLTNLFCSLGAIDFYIGEIDYLGRGLGARILQEFMKTSYSLKYEGFFVDPNVNNLAAIKTYKKAGFIKFQENHDSNEFWIIKSSS